MNVKKFIRVLFVLVLAALIPTVGCSSKNKRSGSKEGDNYKAVADDDAAMNAAIEKAKATSADFIKAFHEQKPGTLDFFVKKPYPTPGNKSEEHMWIEVTSETNGVLTGIVANEAEETKAVKMGQEVTLKISEISDWKYQDGKKLVGGYTIRYFYDRMTPQEKADFQKEAGIEM